MSIEQQLCPQSGETPPPVSEWLSIARRVEGKADFIEGLREAIWRASVEGEAPLQDHLIAAGLEHLFQPHDELRWLFTLPTEARGQHYEALRAIDMERAELLLILSASLDQGLRLRFLVKFLMNRGHALEEWLGRFQRGGAQMRSRTLTLNQLVQPTYLTLIERPEQSAWLITQLELEVGQLAARVDQLREGLDAFLFDGDESTLKLRAWEPLERWLMQLREAASPVWNSLSKKTRQLLDRIESVKASADLSTCLRWAYEKTSTSIEPSLPTQIAFWSNYRQQLREIIFFFDEELREDFQSLKLEGDGSRFGRACKGLSRRAAVCLLRFEGLALTLHLGRAAYIQHLSLESPIYQELIAFEGGDFSQIRDSLGLLSRYPQDDGWQVLLTMLFEERALSPDDPSRDFTLGAQISAPYRLGKGLTFDPDEVMEKDSSLRRYLTRHIGQSGGE